MRFNYEDLKRGSVTKDRIKEVVHSIVYKLDNSLFKQEELERIASIMTQHLEKKLIFHTNTNQINDEEDKKFHSDKAHTENTILNEKKIAFLIQDANHYLTMIELKLLHFEKEKRLLVQHIIDDLMRKEHDEKILHGMIDHANKTAAFNENLIARLRELELEKERLLKELDELHKHYNDLLRQRQNVIKEINVHAENIQNASQSMSALIIANSNHIVVNDARLHEHQSPEQIQDFANRHVQLIEWFEIEKVKLEHKIREKEQTKLKKKRRKNETQAASEKTNGAMLSQYDQHATFYNARHDLLVERNRRFLQIANETNLKIPPNVRTFEDLNNFIDEYNTQANINPKIKEIHDNYQQILALLKQREELTAQMNSAHEKIHELQEHVEQIEPELSEVKAKLGEKIGDAGKTNIVRETVKSVTEISLEDIDSEEEFNFDLLESEDFDMSDNPSPSLSKNTNPSY